ncbi:MAG: hypothetical protein IAG13_21195 [Deltaproteobacteria bacterium]|nr:hypothetical protein [Nannocystaceae bacterium]
MPGAFVHLELHTDDTLNAKAFYKELFGWDYNDVPMGDAVYTMVASSQVPGAGMQHKGMPDAPTMWLPYITVDSVPRSVARARELGAEVIVDFMEAPGFGAGAILRDPTGATFGIWAAEMPAGGVDDAPSDGASARPKAAKKSAKPSAPAEPAATSKKAGKKVAKTDAAAPIEEPAAEPTSGAGKKRSKASARQVEEAVPAPAPREASTRFGKKVAKAEPAPEPLKGSTRFGKKTSAPVPAPAPLKGSTRFGKKVAKAEPPASAPSKKIGKKVAKAEPPAPAPAPATSKNAGKKSAKSRGRS